MACYRSGRVQPKSCAISGNLQSSVGVIPACENADCTLCRWKASPRRGTAERCGRDRSTDHASPLISDGEGTRLVGRIIEPVVSVEYATIPIVLRVAVKFIA